MLFDVILGDASELLGAAGGATVVFVAPLARYFAGKCCTDGRRFQNWPIWL